MSAVSRQRSALWEKSDTADMIKVRGAQLFEGNSHSKNTAHCGCELIGWVKVDALFDALNV